jgi:hypothetical protein
VRILAAAAGAAGLVLMLPAADLVPGPEPVARATLAPAPRSAPALTAVELTASVRQYCVVCHNDQLLTGNLSLQTFDVAQVAGQAEPTEKAEKMIRKLRAEMMPPPGAPRPGGDTLTQLVETLEKSIDAAFRQNPNPGYRTFQRLNRAEYEAAIEDLLGLEINAADWLPVDARSANFDNIADAQTLSPTLLDAYLRAAAGISRMMVGQPNAAPTSVAYTESGYREQYRRLPGAPRGTRGGVSVVHTFPADGDYVFKMWFEHTTTGNFMGTTLPGEQIDVSIDGERVAFLELDRWMNPSDPQGASMFTNPIHVTAGPHRVTAAFLQLSGGPIEDITSPHEWSMTDRNAGSSVYGLTNLAHMKDLYIQGPTNVTGVSDNPARRALFTCYPKTPAEARPCAEQIVMRLATKAFRRPVTADDSGPLMALYDERSTETRSATFTEGFEVGVRSALQAILAMPDFVFRMEEVPEGVKPGEIYRIPDLALASRLSFFLWGTPPDEELIEIAREGKLSNARTLEQQARRLLADPRAQALGTRFAYQWLRLEDLDKVQPDRQMFPNYHQQLADAMKRETELFFYHLVKDDRSFLEAFNADYTFVNERLARHYGILGVSGEEFVRVSYPDASRRGLLGHASVLMSTSHANRTSPVLRGKWVMEVLMGTPPPPPPPGVPTLEETGEILNGRMLTTRERMEMHRKNPTCNACHRFMDPIGLALDNFDVMGRWRFRENGQQLDTRGDFYDGTRITNPAEMTQVLLKRPVPLTRNFAANLMAYALGRRVEWYDMPEVRRITEKAKANDYRMSSFILGVIQSDAFRMKRAPAATEQN